METEGVGPLSATSEPNWRANGVGESAWGDATRSAATMNSKSEAG